MKISGITKKEVFKDEKTGYSGFFLSLGEQKSIFCKGIMQEIHNSLPVSLDGQYKKNDAGKEYFSFTSYEILNENITILNSLDILPEEECKELGQVLPPLKNINNIKEIAALIPQKYKKLTNPICHKIMKMMYEYNLCKLILDAGGRYSDFNVASKRLGDKACQRLISDPYKWGNICGMKYSVCDNIAKKHHITTIDKKRVIGILDFALKQSLDKGNLYIPKEELPGLIKVLDNPIKEANAVPIEYILAIATLEDRYIYENDKLYLRSIKKSEEAVAEAIGRIQKSVVKHTVNEEKLNEIIKNNNLILSENQRETCNCVKNEGFTIITGGPGTGKTTLINIIVQYLENEYKEYEIMLCAPTGAAAQNLSTKTGRKAETIHKMLGLQPYSETKCRVTKKLPIGIYVVDEASMLDLELAESLFTAIPAHSFVLMVGDADQLPSVNAGSILTDMANSEVIPCYKLTDVFRQAEGSSIVENAYEIINGTALRSSLRSDANFNILTVDTSESAYNLAIAYAGNDTEFTVLAPMKKGPAGVYKLNAGIQERINPYEKVRTRYGNMCFKLQDKVMLIKNNYEGGYFNGETGRIVDADEGGLEVMLDKGTSLYVDNSDLSDLALAYAMTIHKSQGSERDNIVIVLPKEAKGMINRNILYTAVTRAKKTVTIIETEGMVNFAINTVAKKRHSSLCEDIRKILIKGESC